MSFEDLAFAAAWFTIGVWAGSWLADYSLLKYPEYWIDWINKNRMKEV